MQKYIILGHENPDVDSIVSGVIYQNYLNRNGMNTEFVIPDENIDEDTLSICRSFHLEPTDYQKPLEFDENTKFILVDHHQRDNIGEIFNIMDHHPDSNSPEGDYYINESSSSTSCLIVQGKEPFFSTHEIELACMAAMVDTASFHSTKSCPWDLDWIKRMCEERKLDYDRLFEAGLTTNSLEDKQKAMFHGLKKHNLRDHKVESSTVHVKSMKKEWNNINDIVYGLMQHVIEQELDIFLFIVHDMSRFETYVYQITKDGYTRKKYDEYTSRGTTIIPELEEELIQKQKVKTSD